MPDGTLERLMTGPTRTSDPACPDPRRFWVRLRLAALTGSSWPGRILAADAGRVASW